MAQEILESNASHPPCIGGLQLYRKVDITEDMVSQAVLRDLSSKCCCQTPRAEDLIIDELSQMPLYRYRLESFIETRQHEKIFKPYSGQKLDGPERGSSPLLWDILVQTPEMFHDGMKKMPLPHSSELKGCHKCQGRGRCKCTRCGGSGQFRCRCSSVSRQKSRNKRCHACSGSGRKRCSKCSGRGRKVCPACKGEGRLIHYEQLTVTWRTLRSECISSPPVPELSLPVGLLHKVTGDVIVKDSDVTVGPLTGFVDNPELVISSQRLIQEHRSACGPSSHILSTRRWS
ncbi:protein SSUH2 homolog isoform X2 [Hyperolius riggenbachi]|uniref:protein SSUH2 homolog isoform X2 n=1 Tax=Hyperolius riggenbachi TaxID=752182 RepID=UPI0035A3084D